MKHTVLMNLAVEIGCRLQESGAEIYRVEEAVRRVFQAYGVDSGQVFAIPNCLIVSAIDEEGRPISRLRRIPIHGTDISRLERVYDFCRAVCRETPEVDAALRRLRQLDASHPAFPLWAQLLAYFAGTGGFTLFWGGGWMDALAGGLCGVAVGLCLLYLGRLGVNLFVKTVTAAFVSALLAALLVRFGLGDNSRFVTTGALMALVPGLVFTNFMRDIMAGDTVAGLIKLVEALLTAAAIAVGTIAAIAAAGSWGEGAADWGGLLSGLWAFLASVGFCVILNIRSVSGGLICCCGGALGWLVYTVSLWAGAPGLLGYFLAAMVISTYSEVMARVRKYPVTGYLLISFLPLVPGSGIYHTMEHALRGNVELFLSQGLHTLCIAGCLALGVLMESSAMHIVLNHRRKRGAA